MASDQTIKERRKMKFDEWMRSQGLSESSIQKYQGAIQGRLSTWATESNFLAGPLDALTSASAFKAVDSKLRQLPVFNEWNTTGHHMYSSALARFQEYLIDGHKNDIEADVDSIFDDSSLSETERKNLVKSRIGQGIFRQRLLSHWKQCAVTGFGDTALLIASHIKPWRDSNNADRLDGFNGLLLTPNLDKAFDSGLITFETDGHIVISPLFKDFEKLGINLAMKVVLSPQHEPFMAFHRTNVFHAGELKILQEKELG
jgi:hypothetical protein